MTATTWSQMQIGTYDTIEYSNDILINGVVDYSANSIEKDIMSKFYKGGFIDEAMKDKSFDKHRAINRAGLDIGGDIVYRNYTTKIFKNKNWGMQFQAGYYNFGGVLYSDDLFGLAFYGNERYLGDTIKMSGTDISFTAFQKFGFGLVDAKTKSSLSLNLYNISNRVSGDFRDLDIIQSEDGMDVSVIMDGEVEMGQSSSFSQGLGVGVDVDYRLNVAWYKERDAKIQFLARNVGFGFMTETQQRYSFDTTINFSGFRFSEILGDNALLSDSVNLLDTLGIQSTDVKPVFMLPGYLQVGKMVDQNSEYQLQSFFGARVYPTLIYSPFVFAGVDYKPIDWLHVGASVSYGGFAGFKTGLYTHMNWDKIQVGLGTDNIIGLVHKSGNGESLFIRLRCKF